MLVQILLVSVGLSQVPSVQLKVKSSSGFLGLGGARYVELRLSDQYRQALPTSESINAGPYYYFECVSIGGWRFDDDFVKDVLSKITIEQYTVRSAVQYNGGVIEGEDTSSVLLGFARSIEIHEPFLFRLQVDGKQSQAQYAVPVEYWPRYEFVDSLYGGAEHAYEAGEYRAAMPYFTGIVANDSLKIFPQYAKAQQRIMQGFQAYLDATTRSLLSLKDSSQLDPRKRIARIAGFRPRYMYVIDSLAPLRFTLGAEDSSIVALLNQARNGVLRIGSITDSLQNALDEQTVQWILDGSLTGKNRTRFHIIIRALAYAFSSLNFSDSVGAPLVVSLPDSELQVLANNDLTDSYATFVRVCNERHQMHLALFPVDFLPNLKMSAAEFPNPFYSMLQAVSDFFAGNLSSCRDAIYATFHTCDIRGLLERFDKLRVIVNAKLDRVPQNVLRLITEGDTLKSRNEFGEAAEKYRQAVILAPDYAYASYALAELSVATGDTAVGLGLLQKAYRQDSLALSAYLRSYDLLQQRQNYGSMIDVMTTAVTNGNDYWITNYELGEACLRNGTPRRAIIAYQRAAELNPQSYETCIELGHAYQAAKDFLKARESYNKALEIDAMRTEAVDALNKLNEEQNARR